MVKARALLATTIPKAGDQEALTTRLSAEERARAASIRHPGARRNFIVARALVRQLLSDFLSCEYDELTIEVDGLGKPRLEGAPKHFDFNISHTDGMVVAVAANCSEVGIDVEDTTRSVVLDAVGQRVFHPDELDEFRKACDPRRAFFEYWTLKEAYMKAKGLGFRLEPKSFCLARGTHPSLRAPEADRNYHFDIQAPSDRHVLAIAASHPLAVEIAGDSH